jgi:hypothetical protein
VTPSPQGSERTTDYVELDTINAGCFELLNDVSPQWLKQKPAQFVTLGRIARLAFGDVVGAVVFGEDDLFRDGKVTPQIFFAEHFCLSRERRL